MTPEIVLGPPGTGKTTTLIREVEEELARGTPPDRIGYVSFTRRAAGEATERACAKFGLDRGQLPYFRTLHSLCFHVLGLTSSDVMAGPTVREFGEWLGIRISQYRSMDDSTLFGYTPGDRALFMENLSRVTLTPLRQLYNLNDDGLDWSLVDMVSRGLAEFKRVHHLVDYTDMLQRFVESGWAPPLEVLFVDESQDLSPLQWRVVDRLGDRTRRVVVAGDDDQAIYRWAGAAVEHFVGLQGQTRVLGQSWRVPPEVQLLSTEIISRVRNRRPKDWLPTVRRGRLERVGDILDVDLSGPNILVLGRNMFTLRSVAKMLRREGMLYELRGKSSVPSETLDAVRNWEALRRGSSLTVLEARQIYALMSTGSGVRRGYKGLPGLPDDQQVDMAWLRESGGLSAEGPWFEAMDRVPQDDASYLRHALQRGEHPSSPRIRLSTIHGSKGGEADHVILLPDLARRTHEEMLIRPEDEARVWYVAVTRTRERLTLTKPHDRLHYML